MNIFGYFEGCLKALGRAGDWPDNFDLSLSGFRNSFLALLFAVPFYYACAVAIQSEQARRPGESMVSPTAPFFLILAMYSLIFVVCAYILCVVFDKMDRFRPWVIVRHWSIFFAAFAAGTLFLLNLRGFLPFEWVNALALVIYLGTLAIDIRLAQKIAGFEWGAAILAGCIITAMGLTVILVGVSQLA